MSVAAPAFPHRSEGSLAGRTTMCDLLLVFPPQWSPFQPALSLPSLAAWLKRAGFAVRSLDLNLVFYEWLMSEECAELLCQQTEESDLSPSLKLAYHTIFRNASD